MKTRKKLKTRKRRLRKRGGMNGENIHGPPPGPPVLKRQSSRSSELILEQSNLLFPYLPNSLNPLPGPENPVEYYNNPLGNDDTQEHSIPEDIDEYTDSLPEDAEVARVARVVQVAQVAEIPPPPCCILTLRQRIDIIQEKISDVHSNYMRLIQILASEVLGRYAEFIDGPILNLSALPDVQFKDFKEKYMEWQKNAKKLLFGYQRLSESDVENAIIALLPQFDAVPMENGDTKFVFVDGSTMMTALIKNYSYKMITSLFTTGNISVAADMYNAIMGEVVLDEEYRYLRNLLSIMHCGSTIINNKLREHWEEHFEGTGISYNREFIYYHSGGNMIVMIAGVLCYLYDMFIRDIPVPPPDSDRYILIDILGKIRRMFESVLGPENCKEFYDWLKEKMNIPLFRINMRSCTENLSDLDFIFMAPFDHVNTMVLGTEVLSRLHALSARIIREIVISSCRYNPAVNNINKCARVLMPFHTQFDESWPDFKFCSLTPHDARFPLHDPPPECNCRGYRQTSSIVNEVPMCLNRLKGGFLLFQGIQMNGMEENEKEDLRNIYKRKYGECVDLSIGIRANTFYEHKHDNYQKKKYYSIDTVFWELALLVHTVKDDKNPKRITRMKFIGEIKIDFMDILFRIIAYYIQEYNMTEEELKFERAEIKGMVSIYERERERRKRDHERDQHFANATAQNNSRGRSTVRNANAAAKAQNMGRNPRNRSREKK